MSVTAIERTRAALLPAVRTIEGQMGCGIYAMARGDQIITLIGTAHLATPGFYEAVLDLARTQIDAGGVVHYELVRPAKSSEVTEDERVVLATLIAERDDNAEALSEILLRAGLASQKQAIYPALKSMDGARNIDMTNVELLRMLGREDFVKLHSSALPVGLMADDYEEAAQSMLRSLRSVQLRAALFGVSFGSRIRKVVIGHRNELAVHAALQAVDTQDVTMIWGAAHLPGMVRQLMLKGFTLVETAWVIAA